MSIQSAKAWALTIFKKISQCNNKDFVRALLLYSLKTAEITEAGVKRVLKLTTNVNNEIANMFTGNVFR